MVEGHLVLVFAGLLRSFIANVAIIHAQLQHTLREFDRVTVVIETAGNVTCSSKDIGSGRPCAYKSTLADAEAHVQKVFGNVHLITLDDSHSTNIIHRLQQVPFNNLRPDMVLALRPDVVFINGTVAHTLHDAFVMPPLSSVCRKVGPAPRFLEF